MPPRKKSRAKKSWGEKEDIEWIFNELRRASVTWPGRSEILRLRREQRVEGYSKKGNPILKYYWQCEKCKKWFRDIVDVEVDHIKEVGGYTEVLRSGWDATMKKLFPRPVEEFLQVLCRVCHQKKTLAYNSAVTRYTRKQK